LEIRQNNLTGADFEQIKNLYPNLYKLKAGENPFKSLDVFKVLVSSFLTFFHIMNSLNFQCIWKKKFCDLFKFKYDLN